MYIGITKAVIFVKKILGDSLDNERGQFAVDMVIGIVVSVVLAAVIVMPSMENLVEDMVTSLSSWWTTIEQTVFKTTMPPT